MSSTNRNPETVTNPAAIAATIRALSPAFKTGWRLGFEGLPCDLPDCVARDATAQHLEDFNEGHRQGRIERARVATDDGSPSMLAEPTRTIMAGNGVVEHFPDAGEMVEPFDDSTGPIDPGMGIVEKLHGNPAGEIAHAVIIPPETLSSSTPAAASASAAGVSPIPAAPKIVAEDGAFRLSSNQRASLERMAKIATSTGDFDLMFSQIEGLVTCDRFDRAIAEGQKSIGKAFGHAAEMVRTQTREARLAIGRQIIANPPSGKQFRADAIRNAEADEAAEREPRDYTEIDPPEVEADEDEGGAW